MSDDDEGAERSFVTQLADSRKRAIEAVHAIRAESTRKTAANLIRETATPHIAAEATASVCDYLHNLRTYSQASDSWQDGIGVIELPQTVPGEQAGLRRGASGSYRCTRMPYLNISDLSAAIRAGNMAIIYSQGGSQPRQQQSSSSGVLYRIGGYELTAEGLAQYQDGTPLDECESPGGVETEFEPASRSEDEQHYKFVFTADQMQYLLEKGDNVANEAGKLGEIGEQPTADEEGL